MLTIIAKCDHCGKEKGFVHSSVLPEHPAIVSLLKKMNWILKLYNLAYESKKIENETSPIILKLVVKNKYDKKLKKYYNSNNFSHLKKEMRTLIELYNFGNYAIKRSYCYNGYKPSQVGVLFKNQLYYENFIEEVYKGETQNLMPFCLDII